MSSDLDQFGQPLRRFPVHWAAALVAASGALVLQSAWPGVLTRPLAHSWWPLDALVVSTASAYLLASAWMHAQAERWRPNELVPRLWQLGHGVLSDGLFGIVGVLGVFGGPESSLLRSGLWIVAPVLLTASAVSGIVTALALRDGMRRFWSDVPPEQAPHGKPRHLSVRSVCAAALFLSLIALGSFEPQVRPWERTEDEAEGASVRDKDMEQKETKATKRQTDQWRS